VGFFIAHPSRIVVCHRLRLLGSAYSLLCGVSRREKVPQALFSLAHPRPPAEVVMAIQNPLHRAKEEDSPNGLSSSFGCGGGI